MTKFKTLRTITAFALVVLMTLLLPVKAIPLPSENETQEQQQIQSEETPSILAEIEENRDSHTKHFMLENGNLMAIQYNTPVHFQRDGSWQEYDNRMTALTEMEQTEEKNVEDATRGTFEGGTLQTAAEELLETASSTEKTVTDTPVASVVNDEPESEYGNRKSDIDIRLSKKAKQNNMVKVKAEGYQISWGYINANKSTVKFIESHTPRGTEDQGTPEHIVQEARYKDVYNGVDLQYFINPNGVKENIILKNKDAQTEFTLQYKIKGLTATQADDKTVVLKDSENRTIYTLCAPFMTDNQGQESSAVTLLITEEKKNKLTLKVSADQAWINQWGREFPVCIDPEVSTGEESNASMTAFVSSAQPTTATQQQIYFYVGAKEPYGTCKGLIKFNQLPQLGEGDRVINATLKATATETSQSSILVKAHNITSTWDNSTVTEDTITYDNTVIDYANFAVSDSSIMSFDITKSAKSWYDGSLANNGVLLETGENAYLEYAGYNFYFPTVRPVLTVTYKNFIGTEPNLTYHTHQAGEKTQVSVSDYLGSLCAQQTIFKGTGARMPVEITATYNSILYNKVFENSSPTGYGWQFSFNQYITETSKNLQSAGYAYIYTDEDGTAHYFKLKADSQAEWADEDNLGLTLTYDESYMYMSDSTEIEKKYALPENGGNILSETDAYGNTITYTYNAENHLTKITDGAGREYTFTYAVNPDTNKNRVSKITSPDGKSVTFTYNMFSGTRDYVSTILYQDGSRNIFSYNSGKLCEIKQKDGSYIAYSYNNDKKISSIEEFGSNNTQGDYLNIAYTTDNTTTFTDRRNRSETYTFDHTGETITVINDSGYITNAEAANNLNVSAGSESFTKNYIKNSNVEYSTSYTKKAWNTNNTGVFTFENSTDTANGEKQQYLGLQSAKITQTNASDFTTFYQTISVSGLTGKDATFSAYIKNAGNVSQNAEKGVLIRGKFFDANRSEIEIDDSRSYNGTSAWQRISHTFSVPSNAVTMEIHCGIKETVGTVWFDCLQLEEGSCMNDYNLIENNDFTGSGGWQGGRNILAVPNQKRGLAQNMSVNKSNVAFVVSGSVEGHSVPLKDDRKFGIKLVINYADTSIPAEEHYQEFNPCTTKEQAVCLQVYPEQANKTISNVSFCYISEYNDGMMKACNAMVNVGDYEFANDANPNSSEEGQEPTDNDVEDESSTEPYHGTIEEIDCYGNLVSLSSGKLLTDIEGNEVLDISNPYMTSSSEYDTTGNYIVSETDERGKTTTYSVNTANGLVNSEKDPQNKKINYTHAQNNNNLLSISSEIYAGEILNNYAYNNRNQLESLTRNECTYSYYYDEFGKFLLSNVGDNNLITHYYSDNNGDLLKSVFGNGDIISYVYDEFNRIKEIKSNGTSMINYLYNKKGLPIKVIDAAAGTTEYTYNMWGKVIDYKTVKNDGTIIQYKAEYDSNMDYVEYMKVGNDTKKITREIDGDGNSFINNDGWKIAEIVDGFSRTEYVKTTPSGNNATDFLQYYTYVDGEETNSTTKLIESVTYKYGDVNVVKYSYVYDDSGNILEIYEDDSLIESYSYDASEQIHSVTDKRVGKYISYGYDTCGNILSNNIQNLHPIYGYLMGSPYGSSYYYNDSSWKDKLTGYGSDLFTYDQIGNPLNYRDGMQMSWKNGKQLEELAINDNLTLNFEYNADGIRTKKIINNESYYDYRYTNDFNLSSMSDEDGNVMQFYYGNDNTANSMRYNGTMYYYVKNLQGDITKIVTSAGVAVANYFYDVWGELISVTDENGNIITDNMSIALINPLRYRGYVYDNESGFYYLQSRYYDPKTGRFINADDVNILKTTIGQSTNTNAYAYCENNPVNLTDPSGYWGIAYTYNVICNFSGISFGKQAINLAVRNSNFNYNAKYTFNKCIGNQKKGNAAKLRLGYYSGSYNGCGWIATYNAFRLLKFYTVQPKSIIYFYETWGSIFMGTFGILPNAIADYFRLLGYKVSFLAFSSNNGLNNIVKNYRICILMYAHSRGAHYVTATYAKSKVDNKYHYYTYNMWSNSGDFDRHNVSLETVFSNYSYRMLFAICIK